VRPMIRGWISFALSVMLVATAHPAKAQEDVEALMERMERFPADCAARFPHRRGLGDAVDAGDAIALRCAIDAWGGSETQAFDLRYKYWRVTGEEPVGLDESARAMERETITVRIIDLHERHEFLTPIPRHRLTGCPRFDAPARALIERGRGAHPSWACNRFGF